MVAPSERLYIRVDASPHTGLGHFTRCLALAQHWRDIGRPATFLGRYAEELEERLAREGISHTPLPASHPDKRDLRTTLDAVPSGAFVVVDGYHFDYAYQEALAVERRVLVIDDIGHLPAYGGHVLLNANLAAREVVYAQAPRERLIGPEYALLRREFRVRRAKLAPRGRPMRRIAVTLGGADAANDTLKVLAGLAQSDANGMDVRVVVGPLNPHSRALEAFADAHAWITLVESPADMAAELAAADLVVASAGSVFFEIAVLGLPSVLVAAADNQLPVGAAAARAGAAVFAGDARQLDARAYAAILNRAVGNAGEIERIRANAVKLIDGDGVVRVGEAVLKGVN